MKFFWYFCFNLWLYCRFDKKDNEKCALINQAIDNKVQLLLLFMANDYDDVSASVFDFAREYIQVNQNYI